MPLKFFCGYVQSKIPRSDFRVRPVHPRKSDLGIFDGGLAVRPLRFAEIEKLVPQHGKQFAVLRGDGVRPHADDHRLPFGRIPQVLVKPLFVVAAIQGTDDVCRARVRIERHLGDIEALVVKCLQDLENGVRRGVVRGSVGVIVHEKVDAHRHHQLDVAGDHPRVGGTIIPVQRFAPIMELFAVDVEIVAGEIIRIFFEDLGKIQHLPRRLVRTVPRVIEDAHIVAVVHVPRRRHSARLVRRRQVCLRILERRQTSGIFHADDLPFFCTRRRAQQQGARQRQRDRFDQFFHRLSSPPFCAAQPFSPPIVTPSISCF